MTSPVDLTNLRSMTDGDPEMEKALFAEFFSSFAAGIASLQLNIAEPETWRKEAHALKGIALNLGAMDLGGLCKEVQEKYNATKEQKNAILEKLCMEYAKVKDFISRF